MKLAAQFIEKNDGVKIAHATIGKGSCLIYWDLTWH
jgi:hypothetical protein